MSISLSNRTIIITLDEGEKDEKILHLGLKPIAAMVVVIEDENWCSEGARGKVVEQNARDIGRLKSRIVIQKFFCQPSSFITGIEAGCD